MKRALIALGIAVLCLPMLLVMYLVLAVRWPRVDPITRSMGESISKGVANAIVQRRTWTTVDLPIYRRAIALDPNNAVAWTHVCWIDTKMKTYNVEVECTRAVGLNPTATNYAGLAYGQWTSGKHCEAEESYRHAAILTNNHDHFYAEGMGREAVSCGDFYGAEAALQLAIGKEEQDLSGAQLDPRRVKQETASLTRDREYLSIALSQIKQPAAAKAMCLKAHPELSTCTCWMDHGSTPAVAKCGGSKK